MSGHSRTCNFSSLRAALAQCGVATGRLDAFYEIGFGGPWDVAAASLILTEVTRPTLVLHESFKSPESPVGPATAPLPTCPMQAGGKVLDPGGGALS